MGTGEGEKREVVDQNEANDNGYAPPSSQTPRQTPAKPKRSGFGSRIFKSLDAAINGDPKIRAEVLAATDETPRDPTDTEMDRIAKHTYTDFGAVIGVLKSRMGTQSSRRKRQDWITCFKAFKVLDYCLHQGDDKVIQWLRADNDGELRNMGYFDPIFLGNWDLRDVRGKKLILAAATALNEMAQDSWKIHHRKRDTRGPSGAIRHLSISSVRPSQSDAQNLSASTGVPLLVGARKYDLVAPVGAHLYIATARWTYVANESGGRDELSFSQKNKLFIFEKDPGATLWWLARTERGDKAGFVPSSYMDELTGLDGKRVILPLHSHPASGNAQEVSEQRNKEPSLQYPFSREFPFRARAVAASSGISETESYLVFEKGEIIFTDDVTVSGNDIWRAMKPETGETGLVLSVDLETLCHMPCDHMSCRAE